MSDPHSLALGGRELHRYPWISITSHQFQFGLVFCLILLAPIVSWAGTWTSLTHAPSEAINTMLLLSDGTVMAAGASSENAWYRLTPDASGSYVNGTWTTLAAMHDTRLYFSSQVLTNGRVFVAGAEYGTGTNSAEVYDPVANTWTYTPPPPAGQSLFYDSVSEMLPNGNVLIAPVEPATYGGTVIYNVAANAWLTGPTLYRGGYQDEASWVKLADQSLLTIDPFGTNSERYIPSLNQWVNDANLPVQLYDPYGSELGAGFLLPDGRAFYLGATGNTALYTPSGNTSPGSWAAGPVIPNSQGTPDAPAAMMVNGVILCAVSPVPTSANHFPSPTSFYEYDPVANAFTQVNGPTATTYSSSTYVLRMLDLPDGTVLLSTSGSQLYVYQPSGSPLAAGQPTITGLTTNAGGSFHLTGYLFNGISEGAAYGDDVQMNSNYPLIRMTNGLGAVFYARTVNWNSTGVQTGGNPVATDFTVPTNLLAGSYSLVVVANGNASAPVTFNYAPDGLLVTPATGFAATGLTNGPFSVTAANFVVTNIGSATLNWSLVNTSTWLNVSATSGSLPPGSPAATVTVSLNAAASNLVVGAYSATLTFSNQTTQIIQPRLFTLQITLPPEPLVISPTNGFAAAGPPGGPFSVVVTSFTLTNIGPAMFNWSLINTSLWLSASASTGSLTPGGPAAAVTVGLNSVASNLVNGVYSTSLLFSNQTTQVVQTRQFTLRVSSELVQNGGFETGDFSYWVLTGNTGSSAYTTVTTSSSYVHSGNDGVQTGPATSSLYLSQTLGTVAGQNYVVSFWLKNSSGSTPTQFQATWGGSNLVNLANAASFGWSNLVFIVTANSSSTLLQFGFRNDPSYFGFDDVSVVPLPATVLQSMTRTNNTFGFTWNSVSGLVYQLQYKTNLTQVNWINLGNPMTATGSGLSTTDSPGADGQRFYRLLVLP